MNKINNTSLNLKDIGKEVVVFGFVSNKRKMGKLVFVDLRDRSGIIQVVFRNKETNFFKESVLEVKGEVVKRKNINKDLLTGQIEIKVKNFKILSKTHYELPFVIRDDLDAKEDTRLRHRYLDLRRPKMQKILKTRHIIIKAIRDFLDAKDFYEIETPMLSKSTPEGARDFIVPTRKDNNFFALPQSPQLYKQLLMVSGLEKYFQITKVFRDEDPRKDRQPEFTQLDIEMSYENEETLKSLIEKMYVNVFKSIAINLKIPFARMNYDKAIEYYGTDKPDTRYKYLLEDVKSFFTNTTFNAFKNATTVKMIAFDNVISKKDIKILEEVAKKNGAKGLAYTLLQNNMLDGIGARFMAKESKKLFKKSKLNKGTLIFVADNEKNVNASLGAVRVKLNELFDLANDDFNFVWIENWPLFKKDNKTGKFISNHHPFTAPKEESIAFFEKDKANVMARSYDLVLNGFELGSGSVRINDLKIQKLVFDSIGINEKEQQEKFDFFLEAFKYGMPPHLGIAFGIDRLMMIIEKTNSIRDVIAFPKNANYQSIMEKSPSKIDNEHLKDYNIKNIDNKK